MHNSHSSMVTGVAGLRRPASAVWAPRYRGASVRSVLCPTMSGTEHFSTTGRSDQGASPAVIDVAGTRSAWRGRLGRSAGPVTGMLGRRLVTVAGARGQSHAPHNLHAAPALTNHAV